MISRNIVLFLASLLSLQFVLADDVSTGDGSSSSVAGDDGVTAEALLPADVTDASLTGTNSDSETTNS